MDPWQERDVCTNVDVSVFVTLFPVIGGMRKDLWESNGKAGDPLHPAHLNFTQRWTTHTAETSLEHTAHPRALYPIQSIAGYR